MIYSPSGAVINLLELISLLFLSRIVMMRRRVTRDLIKSVARGVICVHNKKRIPWLGDNENYSERRYSDAVSFSFQAPNFGQREYNRSRSGPRGFETTDFQSRSSGESPYRLRSEIKSDQIVFIQLHTDLSEIQFTPDNSTTLAKSNLVLTRTKIDFPWFFLYIYGNFTRGNSNTR